MFKVTIAVCAHRDIKAEVFKTLWLMKQCPNFEVNVKIQDGDALISRSRSLVATYFIEKTKDDILFFIDDDINISTFDMSKLITMAYEMKLPIVGAAYTTKSKNNPGLAVRPLQQGKLEFGKKGKVYEMRSVSTGCMAIKREVFEKMIEKETIHYCRHGNHQYYPFFQHREGQIDGLWEDLSEDWWFCEKARELGFNIYCDTTIKTGHIGPYEFTWDDIIETKNKMRKQYDSPIFTVGEEKVPDFRDSLKRAFGMTSPKAEALTS